MELITEMVDLEQIQTEIIQEACADGVIKKKTYITGPFMEAAITNGNGRIYPVPVIANEVKRLNESRIPQNRFLGELNHPNVIEVNLERVSHLIKELKMEGNAAMGKALLLDTPMGMIAQALVSGGVKIGISSRGVGTLRESIVQNDFRVSAIDLVSDPSAPNALMDIVMEGKKEWVLENGLLTEKELMDTVAEVNKIVIDHQFSKEDRAAATLKMFQECLGKISAKHNVIKA
jgi:hypothetical protein